MTLKLAVPVFSLTVLLWTTQARAFYPYGPDILPETQTNYRGAADSTRSDELLKVSCLAAVGRYLAVRQTAPETAESLAVGLDSLIRAYPSAPWLGRAHLALADHYFAQGQYRAAATHFRHTARLDSGLLLEPDLVLKQGGALRELGAFREAIPFLEQSLRDTVLRDYVLFWLAEAYAADNQTGRALEVLENLLARHRYSLLREQALARAAELEYQRNEYGPALTRFQELAAVTTQSGRAAAARYYQAGIYEKRHDPARACTLFLAVMEQYRRSEWALFAYDGLRRVAAQQERTLTDREGWISGNVLAAHRRYAEAQVVFADLVARYPQSLWRMDALAAQAKAWYALGQYGQAGFLCQQVLADTLAGAAEADALFYLARTKRVQDATKEAMDTYLRFGQKFPNDPHAVQALWIVGWHNEANQDYAGAARVYVGIARQYGHTALGNEAQWRAGFCWFKQGEYDAASAAWGPLLSSSVLGVAHQAAYWTGKAYTAKKEPGRARRIFRGLFGKFPLTYYSIRAGMALDSLPGPYPPGVRSRAQPDNRIGLKKFWDTMQVKHRKKLAVRPVRYTVQEKLHLAKAQRFLELDLPEMAVREFLSVEDERRQDAGALRRLLDGYLDHGLWYRAHRAGYKLWELLGLADTDAAYPASLPAIYPPLYYPEIDRVCREHKNVDPYLVLALIRQESNYNARVVSPAHAVGLMQLLPSTAELVAKEAGLPDYNERQLTDARVNIRLGTRFLAGQLRKYNGNLERTLAAYNGGERSFRRAQGLPYADDTDMFVEEVEFRETRNYIKTVIRNYWMYWKLWGGAGDGSDAGKR
jgi:soluble lytic murein transglycosylase